MARRSGWHGPRWSGDFPSLGDALLDWYEAMLVVPLGPDAGVPFVLEGWQPEATLRFYAIRPEDERFAYRRGVAELAKGTGKSPWAAATAWGELLAPTVFDHWAEDGEESSWGYPYRRGEPVGRVRPTPWIQIAASAFDQTDNSWLQLTAMAQEGSPGVPGAPLHQYYNVEIGVSRVQVKGGFGRIEPVTSKSGTRVGQPLTFAVLEETWVMRGHNNGPALAATVRENLTKGGGRSVEVTNAYEPGTGSVAEASAQAAHNPRSRILHLAVEGPEVLDPKDPEELLPALRQVYAECPWVDPEQIVEDCMADDVTAISVRRRFLNHHVASETRFVSDDVLEAVCSPDLLLEPGASIALGFDGSKRHDGTALVAMDMASGVAFLLGSWRRPAFADRDWEVPRPLVMDRLHEVFAHFKVVRMKYDPAWWADEMSRLQNAFGKEVVDRFPTQSHHVTTESLETVQQWLRLAARSGERVISTAGESWPLVDDMRSAQVMALPWGSRTFYRLSKPEDGRLIDCAAALTYAGQARREALARGWTAPLAVDIASQVW